MFREALNVFSNVTGPAVASTRDTPVIDSRDFHLQTRTVGSLYNQSALSRSMREDKRVCIDWYRSQHAKHLQRARTLDR